VPLTILETIATIFRLKELTIARPQHKEYLDKDIVEESDGTSASEPYIVAGPASDQTQSTLFRLIIKDI
jgi:hypothetical protein